jgi:hypothetical protein
LDVLIGILRPFIGISRAPDKAEDDAEYEQDGQEKDEYLYKSNTFATKAAPQLKYIIF